MKQLAIGPRQPAQLGQVDEGLTTPNLVGDLEVMFEVSPSFRWKRHGYSAEEVDNCIAWLREEMLACRRTAKASLRALAEATNQLTAQNKQLESLRAQTGAEPSTGPEWISQRVRDILQLAAEEAQALIASAQADAVSERDAARLRLDEELAHSRRASRQLLDDADVRRARTDAQAAAARLAAATASRRKIAVAERTAAERLAVMQHQLDELTGLRDAALQSLRNVLELASAAEAALGDGTGATSGVRFKHVVAVRP